VRIEESGWQPGVLVYSNGKIDVYISQASMDAPMQYELGFNGDFSATLYFVFRDEATRQQAVALLRSHYGPPVHSTCREEYEERSKHVVGTGVRDVPCIVHTQTFDNFKYAVMDVYYHRVGMRASYGMAWAPGPLLNLYFSDYRTPLECATRDKSPLVDGSGKPYIKPGYETLLDLRELEAGNLVPSATWGPSKRGVLANDASFGTESKTLGNPGVRGAAPIWDLLLGDLAPLEDPQVGVPDVLRMNTLQTSFVYRALEAIQAKMMSNWAKLHPDAQNCSYWHARMTNVEMQMGFPDIWARCKGELGEKRSKP